MVDKQTTRRHPNGSTIEPTSRGNKRTLIKVSNIEQSFKVGEEMVDVLHPSSFTIQENTFNIIYGPSGSGKSTLLNVLSAIQPPSKGRVEVAGFDIYRYKPEQLAYFRGSQIGVVYQSNYWVNSLNVIENVALPLYFLGKRKSEAHRLAMDALQRIDMAPFAKKSPLMMSGGEQQRVAMARAIVADPMLIIADEPTGSLDTKNGDMIMALLQSYNRDLNRTIILVTHNMEYLPLADKLIRINDGVCTEMDNDDVGDTTRDLIKDMTSRIDKLAESKKNG
jgi:ABC-type lipoprotein export system ATPase subunit